jgi:hypothetical protein
MIKEIEKPIRNAFLPKVILLSLALTILPMPTITANAKNILAKPTLHLVDC